jgi:hypothetical protein
LIIEHLQIDTLPTQKLELTYHELSCSRLERQIFNFLSKLAVRFMSLKANLLKKLQKNCKFPSQYLMSSTKMIQKWVPYAMQCYAGKNGKKWPFSTSVHWPKLLLGLDALAIEKS